MAREAYTDLDSVRRYGASGQLPSGTLITEWKDDQIITDALFPYSRAIDTECAWAYFGTEEVTDKIITATLNAQSKVTVDQAGYLWLKTPYPTIQSVSALAFRQLPSQSWIPLDVTNVLIETLDDNDVPSGLSNQIGIMSAGNVAWGALRNTVFFLKVSYVGGYANVPDAIRRACAEWVYHDYRLREFVPTGTVGFIGMPQTVIKPSQIPPHIFQLIKNYKRTAQ